MRGVIDDNMAAVQVVESSRGRSVLDGLEDHGTAQHGDLRREVWFVLDRRGSVGIRKDHARREAFDDDLARGRVDPARGEDVVAEPRSPPLRARDENFYLAPSGDDALPALRRLRPDLQTSLEDRLVPDRFPPVQIHYAVRADAPERHVLDAGQIVFLEVDGDGELSCDVCAPTSRAGGFEHPNDLTVGTAQPDFQKRRRGSTLWG